MLILPPGTMRRKRATASACAWQPHTAVSLASRRLARPGAQARRLPCRRPGWPACVVWSRGCMAECGTARQTRA